MTIDDELIKYVEDLSKLRLSHEEREQAKSDLTAILGYIDTLSELDVGTAEGLSHPFKFVNCFRDDVPAASADRDIILLNAPRKKDGCFIAPKTVE
ncbi:MAG: Asp-tRNA(Asn)/Glu-tRNA(Gln) amidotransferase subunit GatC [Clostridiales bacterium]|jgi:aspartyl-tRNA(Asn)/glutamyl-tRNA(Gln) amidotransferase subunit C|nr:Asp-tRNA(Asn)/Glu-tRNA(Gln) amidotransferase subunit GatC [Clostridiales bacterium]